MKTLTIGCIKANTQRSLALDSVGSSSSSAGTSSAAVHTAETDATIIAHRLRLCVGVINKIQIHVYEAIALDIATLVRPNQSGQESKYEPGTKSESQGAGSASQKGKQRAGGEPLGAGATASTSSKGKRKAEVEQQDVGTASRKGKQKAKGELQDAGATAGSGRKGKRKAEADPEGPNDQRLCDLKDILENEGFYYSVCTLLCSGKLGAMSRYERIRNALATTMATRRTPAGSRAAMQVPHAQRVYDRYKAASAFIPFADQGIISMFPSTVARLAVRMVMNAIRAHYYGSKVRSPTLGLNTALMDIRISTNGHTSFSFSLQRMKNVPKIGMRLSIFSR